MATSSLRLGLDEPQDDIAVALAGATHGPQTGEDSVVQSDKALAALVDLVLVADGAERALDQIFG